jgi:hypothetical protein
MRIAWLSRSSRQLRSTGQRRPQWLPRSVKLAQREGFIVAGAEEPEIEVLNWLYATAEAPQHP